MQYRTALITGASSGLGRSVALRLARDGTEVVLAARRADQLTALAEEIVRSGGRAQALPLNVSDTERTVAAIRQADEEIGGLDLIFANAGIGLAIHGTRLAWERIRDLCMVNFNGAVATLCAVLPGMVARGRGHLVGVSSLAALAPLPMGAAYGGSKAGLTMFLDALWLDLQGSGVGVTVIHPGFVRTPMTAHIKKSIPFALEAHEAADLIVEQLRKVPRAIDFPLAMVAPLRAIAALPAPLRDAALRRFPGPDESE
jgi:short-subunit dehydrogenase